MRSNNNAVEYKTAHVIGINKYLDKVTPNNSKHSMLAQRVYCIMKVDIHVNKETDISCEIVHAVMKIMLLFSKHSVRKIASSVGLTPVHKKIFIVVM